MNCKLDSALEKAMDSIHELSHLWGAMGDTVNSHQMSVEIDTLEKNYSQTVDIIQSTLVISKSKGPSKTVRDIRTSTYQICSIEEKTI